MLSNIGGTWREGSGTERTNIDGVWRTLHTIAIYQNVNGTWRSQKAPAGTLAYNTGTHQFTVPSGITRIIINACAGGGAGGGSMASGTGPYGAGGGGGGQFLFNQQYTVTPGQILNLIIGAGGTGVLGLDGNKGGVTTIAELSISLNGGGGGARGFNNSLGGAGGGTITNISSPGAGGNGGGGSNNGQNGNPSRVGVSQGIHLNGENGRSYTFWWEGHLMGNSMYAGGGGGGGASLATNYGLGGTGGQGYFDVDGYCQATSGGSGRPGRVEISWA